MLSRGTFWIAILAIIVVVATSLNATQIKDISLNNGHAKANAITADPLSSESLLKNPATTGYSDRETLVTHFGSHFDNAFQTGLISWSGRVQNIGIGLSIPGKLVQDIPEVIEQVGVGVEVGQFQDIEGLAMLSLSFPLTDSISFGIAGNYYYHQIITESGQGYGFDAGILIDTDLGFLGASIQNIGATSIEWTTGTTDTIAEAINIGIATHDSDFGRIIADARLTDTQTAIYSAAYEVMLRDVLMIQGGVHNIGQSNQLTLGCLLQLDPIGLQYSYSKHESLGSVHKVGVRYEAY